MNELSKIMELGNPILRKKAVEIIDLSSQEIKELVKALKEMVIKYNGVGLAAPQIGKSFRSFIMASRPSSRYPDAPDMAPEIIINPEIISFSNEIVKDWEGCLSIPGIRGFVPRYEAIKVSYLSEDGMKIEREFSGFTARIFQHELDHLNGIVFLDRLDSNMDIVTEREYIKIISN